MLHAISSYHAAGSSAVTAPDHVDGQHGRAAERQNQGTMAGVSSSPDVQLNLSKEAQQALQELRQRDQEVRSHEQAHINAGGAHVQGGASFAYTQGPDNQYYATSGEVQIDTAPVYGNPEKTIEKAQTVRQAALAPAQPSAEDFAVAAKATQMEAQARMEKASAAYERMNGERGLALMGTGLSLSV